MSMKVSQLWKRFGLCGICVTTLLSAIPSMSQATLFPAYIDNSQCLLNPESGCSIYSKPTVQEGFLFPFYNNPAARLTGGSIRFHWPRDSEYTKLMNQVIVHPQVNSAIPVGGYMLNITDSDMSYKVRLRRLKDNIEQLADCHGKLRLDTRFYRNYLGDNSGFTCQIPEGYVPIDITVYTNQRTVNIYMNNPNATDRTLSIPGLRLRVLIEGWWVDQNGHYERTQENWEQYDRRLFLNEQPRYYIQLNERICKISTATTNIDFGTISETARGKQREVKMPFTVQCAGKAVPNQSNFTGVKNHLLGFRVEANPQRAGDPTKVDLFTDGQVRDDLYVEGSYLGGQQCGVAPLQTNKSLNKFDQPIELGTGQSVSTNQPTIYWRLCADPKDGKNLKTGSFSGQAVVDIEYN